ncbi:hypothetical protein EYF80_028657 [Liparis tanakae]|uniref:Uncharacterized protein n=1 Tax=Liparis tanakae TaxID=230148 RepID=A0A4Z2H5R9_9TELE|nr:hypothetical protein EYF80_028657 [Liparis tanakae]
MALVLEAGHLGCAPFRLEYLTLVPLWVVRDARFPVTSTMRSLVVVFVVVDDHQLGLEVVSVLVLGVFVAHEDHGDGFCFKLLWEGVETQRGDTLGTEGRASDSVAGSPRRGFGIDATLVAGWRRTLAIRPRVGRLFGSRYVFRPSFDRDESRRRRVRTPRIRLPRIRLPVGESLWSCSTNVRPGSSMDVPV